MVAKTYQSFPHGEPYLRNSKTYVLITKANGTQKEVRWYDAREYKRLYPDDPCVIEADTHTKSRFGFDLGPVQIPVGKVSENSDWLKASNARWCRWFGWYFVATEPTPLRLPDGLALTAISWDKVSKDENTFKSEEEIKAYVSSLGGNPAVI